jgi:2-dehydro-3-deoxyphosphogluconate aldolase/(4S)-4-hydroxy-2-oxoglutarate aldolase
MKWSTHGGVEAVKKEELRARIEEIGIIPAVRVEAPEHARYAAEALHRSGIPIAEMTMTVPGAIQVISEVAQSIPEMIVGAGTVLDVETAQRCLDAGAVFLTSTGFVPEVVEFARKKGVLVIPGALTPSEVIQAWKAGADFVKIFPCESLGGDNYIRALKRPFPHVPMVAAGGVNQQTASNYILAGASALGVGGELIPKEALERKQEHRIRELARRFLASVKEARNKMAAA